jgi:hypothetical protein
LGAAGLQAGNGGVDVVDGECDVADARRVRRSGRAGLLVGRRVELGQLDSAVAVRRLHHRNVRPHALEPDNAVHPTTLDRPLALHHKSELDEERNRGGKIVNHDADVIHPLDSHLCAIFFLPSRSGQRWPDASIAHLLERAGAGITHRKPV